jgi:hypothetical protein
MSVSYPGMCDKVQDMETYGFREMQHQRARGLDAPFKDSRSHAQPVRRDMVLSAGGHSNELHHRVNF